MHKRNRTIAALATVIAAVGVAVGSGATFNSQSANPENTFSSGTFSHSNSKDGVSIVTGANMKPGDVKTGEVTITNTGSIDGTFNLAETNDSNDFKAGSLNLKIDDVTDKSSVQEIYKGDLGGVDGAGINLGEYAADEARTYRFTVTFAQSASNADQGKTASADYVWTAVQK